MPPPPMSMVSEISPQTICQEKWVFRPQRGPHPLAPSFPAQMPVGCHRQSLKVDIPVVSKSLGVWGGLCDRCHSVTGFCLYSCEHLRVCTWAGTHLGSSPRVLQNLPELFSMLTTVIPQVVRGVNLKCPQEGLAVAADAPFLPASFNSEGEICQAVAKEVWLFSEEWSLFHTRKWGFLKILCTSSVS